MNDVLKSARNWYLLLLLLAGLFFSLTTSSKFRMHQFFVQLVETVRAPSTQDLENAPEFIEYLSYSHAEIPIGLAREGVKWMDQFNENGQMMEPHIFPDSIRPRFAVARIAWKPGSLDELRIATILDDLGDDSTYGVVVSLDIPALDSAASHNSAKDSAHYEVLKNNGSIKWCRERRGAKADTIGSVVVRLTMDGVKLLRMLHASDRHWYSSLVALERDYESRSIAEIESTLSDGGPGNMPAVMMGVVVTMDTIDKFLPLVMLILNLFFYFNLRQLCTRVQSNPQQARKVQGTSFSLLGRDPLAYTISTALLLLIPFATFAPCSYDRLDTLFNYHFLVGIAQFILVAQEGRVLYEIRHARAGEQPMQQHKQAVGRDGAIAE